jgi:hypothetical protein
VQAHAHAHRAELAPVVILQRTLRGKRRAERIVRVDERGAQPVADHVKHAPVVLLDHALQQFLMSTYRTLSRVGVLLNELRGPLDVGEQERDRSSREVGDSRRSHDGNDALKSTQPPSGRLGSYTEIGTALIALCARFADSCRQLGFARIRDA